MLNILQNFLAQSHWVVEFLDLQSLFFMVKIQWTDQLGLSGILI